MQKLSTLAIVLLANSLLAQSQTPWLSRGEHLGLPLNANTTFDSGTDTGSHLGRTTDWLNEITTGETTGYWQTPYGPSEKNTRFLLVNRGYDNWSQNEVRLVPAKPPVINASYNGFSLQLFPYLDDRPEELTVSFPAIGVRQGEASYTGNPLTITTYGALVLQGQAWVPNHTTDVGQDQTMRPSIYLTVDLLTDTQSVGKDTEIRIPVDLGSFEQWKTITIRLDWRTKSDETWFEWHVWDPTGNLIVPNSTSAQTRCTLNKANTTEPYPFAKRQFEFPWSAVAVLHHKGNKWQAIQKADMRVTPRIIAGSWLSVESTKPFYPMCGEAYLKNVVLRKVTGTVYK